MKSTFLLFLAILGTNSVYAQDGTSSTTREFCTNRRIDLNLGKSTATTIWSGGQLCLSVTPDLKDAEVLTYSGGQISNDGDWYGQESAPQQHDLTLQLVKSEQRGENRKMHYMKVKNSEADIYLTFFTSLDGTTLDSVAFLSYHKSQSFNFNFSGAKKGLYTKNKGVFKEGYPDETISLMRSILLNQ